MRSRKTKLTAQLLLKVNPELVENLDKLFESNYNGKTATINNRSDMIRHILFEACKESGGKSNV